MAAVTAATGATPLGAGAGAFWAAAACIGTTMATTYVGGRIGRDRALRSPLARERATGSDERQAQGLEREAGLAREPGQGALQEQAAHGHEAGQARGRRAPDRAEAQRAPEAALGAEHGIGR